MDRADATRCDDPPVNGAKGSARSRARGFDVVVFDFDGVCTPSPGEFIASRNELATLRPTLAPVIAQLRDRGSQIALLSNEFDRAWMSDIEEFPEFDHVFVGSDNRIFKPDRRAFQRVLYAVGCDANGCLVIDDDETNCRVARSIGCHAIQFDPDDVTASWAAALAAGPAPE